MPKAKKTDRKRFEKQEQRRVRNRSVRSAVKTFISRARQSAMVAEGPDAVFQVQAATLRAVRALDKAAQKGIIHKNNAARRKSRLMKRINAAVAEVQAAS